MLGSLYPKRDCWLSLSLFKITTRLQLKALNCMKRATQMLVTGLSGKWSGLRLTYFLESWSEWGIGPMDLLRRLQCRKFTRQFQTVILVSNLSLLQTSGRVSISSLRETKCNFLKLELLRASLTRYYLEEKINFKNLSYLKLIEKPPREALEQAA